MQKRILLIEVLLTLAVNSLLLINLPYLTDSYPDLAALAGAVILFAFLSVINITMIIRSFVNKEANNRKAYVLALIVTFLLGPVLMYFMLDTFGSWIMEVSASLV
ncbi:MAG: hypothetical protein KBC38_00320 [Candidatus Pacebacteria bacterium]|nr:hypothetical protein [Candidatus Paceibacterota bacterium]MBP9840442.1 hypothetical protein [Candidatus Paceibacterota bacterium]